MPGGALGGVELSHFLNIYNDFACLGTSWGPHGGLLEGRFGNLGGHFGHPWGHLGHPRGHFGAPGVAKVARANLRQTLWHIACASLDFK